jgi:hypothetical protein
MALRFTATIEIRGINPFVRVSKEQAEQLQTDWRKPLPVLVQVDGKPDPPWDINMMPAGDGSFYLYLHGSIRKAAGKQVGDQAVFDVSFNTRYRGGPTQGLPEWFEQALEANPVARENWVGLTPSRQKEIVRYFSSLKGAEAQERHLKRALSMLSGESGRFMARSWKNGE